MSKIKEVYAKYYTQMESMHKAFCDPEVDIFWEAIKEEVEYQKLHEEQYRLNNENYIIGVVRK